MFSTSGMSWPGANLFFNNLVSLVIEKNADLQYPNIMGQLLCSHSVYLLR